MKRIKILFGALVCMCMVFLVVPEVHAQDVALNGWVQEGSDWYYYEEGYMVRNQLIEDPNGDTYYVDENGVMVTDVHLWAYDGYRYFNEDGVMLKSSWREETVFDEWGTPYDTDWYYYGSDGIAYGGVQEIDGTEYYFWWDGRLADWETVQYDDVYLYKINDEGIVVAKTNINYGQWILFEGKWYWFDAEWEPAYGLKKIGDVEYYFDGSGQLVDYETVTQDDGYLYKVSEAGVVVAKTTINYGQWTSFDGEWYWFDAEWEPAEGIRKIGSTEYYFYSNGQLANSEMMDYDDVYLFKVSKAGVVVAKTTINYGQWTSFDGEWYWFDAEWEPAYGLREIGNATYYFEYEGRMVSDTIVYTSEGQRAFNASGAMIKGGWYLNLRWGEKQWYYFDASGAPAEGWVLSGSSWYYLEYGAPRVGDYIMEYNGKDYYFSFDTDGRMLKQVAVKTGWFSVDGIWYYYNGERLLQDEWATIGSATYYFDSDGSMVVSSAVYVDEDVCYVVDENGYKAFGKWVCDYEGDWIYADENGYAVTNDWKLIGSTWYYFRGAWMVTEPMFIDGQLNLFAESGKWLGVSNVTTGWVAAYDSWYYLEDGEIVTGWKYIGNRWYYFDENSYLAVRNDYIYIDGVAYGFSNSGALANGWVYNGRAWYLTDSAGVLKSGWQLVGGTWYYLDYEMYYDGLCWIDGDLHLFAENGAWLGTVDVEKDGWQLLNGEWYYFEDGDWDSGFKMINGQIYYFNDAMLKNDYVWSWINSYEALGSKQYICGFDANGVLAKNKWLYIDDFKEWVWFDKEGIGVIIGIDDYFWG